VTAVSKVVDTEHAAKPNATNTIQIAKFKVVKEPKRATPSSGRPTITPAIRTSAIAGSEKTIELVPIASDTVMAAMVAADTVQRDGAGVSA
jgi:hypothetical protein